MRQTDKSNSRILQSSQSETVNLWEHPRDAQSKVAGNLDKSYKHKKKTVWRTIHKDHTTIREEELQIL